MTEKAHADVLTERHLQVFGAILQSFARYELTIEHAIAAVLKTDASSIAILVRHLDFVGKRAALLELLQRHAIPAAQWERIFAYLAKPRSHVELRGDIAHSTWVASPEPRSIQPSWILRPAPGIEPTHPGSKAEARGYTLEMLSDVAAKLAHSHAAFRAYLAEAGLIRS